MNLVRGSLKNSTAVVVGMILTALFGFLALIRIPIQLNPTIESPYITVETLYPGASAQEVEQEITLRLEEKLASVEDLRELRSTSREGLSEISLKFKWGVNKDLAQLDVLQKLNLAEELPEDAEGPQILTVNRREQPTIMWLYMQSSGIGVNEIRQIVDDVVLPRIERVPDVANIRRFGGAEREIHVLVDLTALAARELVLDDISTSLSRENRNVRGGKMDKGSTQLVVRTLGQYASLEQIRRTVIKNTEEGPVRIQDIGEVQDAHEDTEAYIRVNGQPTVAMGVVQSIGANTLEVAEEVKKVVAILNKSMAGRGVEVKVTYDSSEYIWGAIYQLRDNLILGSVLATAVIWFFLRSVAATLILGITIPVCMVGTFVLLTVFGRSVNVVSLAGLAFASGLIVDNGIVVIENICRHRRELGKPILQSALDGTLEVWGAIVAASLTTLAVFIPILFIQERAGQLFRDIAFSIVFAIALSMIAAITIVPMLSSRWLERLAPGLVGNREDKSTNPTSPISRLKITPILWLHKLADLLLVTIGRWVGLAFMGTVHAGLRKNWLAGLIITAIMGLFLVSLWLVPPAEYLPRGNENFILGLLKLPSGLSVDGSEVLMRRIEKEVLTIPELDRTFFVILRDMPIFGLILKKEMADKGTVQRISGNLSRFVMSRFPFPDVIPIIFQVPVFGRGSSGGKSISVDVSGPDIGKLEELTNQLADSLRGLPGVQTVRPSLSLDNPELRVIPNRDRLSDLGMTAGDVADVVETLIEGRTVSLYREGGKEYDLVVKALEHMVRDPEDLSDVMIPTPGGEKVELIDVARIERRHGPVAVERLEQERSSTLEVTVDEGVPLQKLIQDVEEKVIGEILDTLPLDYHIGLSGSADDLQDTMTALADSFILAVVIIYLLLAALFRSFFHPLVILFSVPLAMTGAFLGIRASGVEFNVITMLGFILLAGVVVNNAILLVQVTLVEFRKGISIEESIMEGMRQRIRPIFMTSVTSVLGMSPMAFGKGTGSDLYNSLGIAVIGGLIFSTLFTLVLIPLLLKVSLSLRNAMPVWLGREDFTEGAAAERLKELDTEPRA